MRDLYKLTVGIGDGQVLTLGEMNDQIKGGLEIQGREDTLETERASFQNELMRTRGELEQAVALAQVTPEMQAQGAQAYQELLAREQAALRAAVPELSDPDYRKATHEGVTKLAAEYGITGPEVDGLADHRVYKLAMDFAALRKRVAAADPNAKRIRKGTQAGSGNQAKTSGNNAAVIDKAKTSGLVNDQVSAVAAILGSTK